MSFLSVVVATYRRADVLRTTLDRLCDQTLSKELYEVLVVDDGSPDTTPEMVTEYQSHNKLSLTYLRHENSGPGFTQNRGIRAAKGPWILLIADDIHPQPEMLEQHFRLHQSNPQPHVAVAGKVVQSPDLPSTVFLRNWDPFRYVSFERFDELSYINFWACNVSFKKDFMLQYGMFIERKGAAHEDTEVGWRLYRQGGLRLLYCKEALGYHYHVEDIDSACRRAYERGRNFDVLCDSVNDTGLYIRDHIVTRKTLPLFLRNSNDLHAPRLDEDKNPYWFLLREALRRMIFNPVTVPWLFMPVVRQAEQNRLLAALVTPKLIRGSVAYHFLKGLSDLRHERAQSPTAAPLPV